jgi:serine phosphatase RsbU (regulator of sigma subunit)
VLLTDGITEAANADREIFGAEGALEFIRRQPRSTADELVRGLYAAVRAFAGAEPQADDITALICKVA